MLRLFVGFSSAKTLFETGVLILILIDHIRQMLKNNYISIDYVNINQDTLDPFSIVKNNRILIAGYLNQTRLIDNLAL